MRHRKGNKHLGRTSPHVRAMVRNSCVNLFRHEKIKTTIQKAKVVRRWAEKMITLGKDGTLHARRRALSLLGSKPAVAKLFRTLGPRYASRSGGYTRIVRLAETIRPAMSDRGKDLKNAAGARLGDGASLVFLELVEADVKPREKRRRKPPPEPFRPRRELFRDKKSAEEPAGAPASPAE